MFTGKCFQNNTEKKVLQPQRMKPNQVTIQNINYKLFLVKLSPNRNNRHDGKAKGDHDKGGHVVMFAFKFFG